MERFFGGERAEHQLWKTGKRGSTVFPEKYQTAGCSQSQLFPERGRLSTGADVPEWAGIYREKSGV